MADSTDPFETLKRQAARDVSAPLPAAEVRAMGNRMRRRRTAFRALAAAAAVAVVITGGVALGGGRPSGSPDPVPPASQGPQSEDPEPTSSAPSSTATEPAFSWRTEIPEGFPLAQGYPEVRFDEQKLVGPGPDVEPFRELSACDVRYEPVADQSDRLAVRFEQPEDFRFRELTLHASDRAARENLARLLDVFGSCPRTTDDLGWSTIHEERSIELGDEGHVVIKTAEFQGAPAIGLELIYAVRVGNALLVSTTSNEGGGNEKQIYAQVREQTQILAGIVDAMCVFSRDGCVNRAEAAEDAAEEAARSAFGPLGFAGVELGMPADAAPLTTVMEVAGQGSCRHLTLRKLPPGEGGERIDGFVTERHGVVALFARPGAATPESIQLGDTLAQVREAYPSAHELVAGWVVTVPGYPDREYEFLFERDELVSMSLSFPDQRCFG